MLGNVSQTILRLGLTALAISLLCFFCTDSAMAQCVMCRASLGNNSVFARNLNIGTLVLLIPPVSIFCAIFILAIRHRKSG